MCGNLEGGGGRHDERVYDTTVIVSGEESSEYSFASNGGELRGSFLDDGDSELDGIQEEEEDDESLSSNNSNRSSRKKQPLGGNSNIAKQNNFPTTYTVESTARKTPDSVKSPGATIDSSARGDGEPTPQQLSRYSNMVRLGIPDVAVLQSMERDRVSNTQSILQSLKEKHVPAAAKSKEDGATATPTKSPSRDRQDIFQRRGTDDLSLSGGSVGSTRSNRGGKEETLSK